MLNMLSLESFKKNQYLHGGSRTSSSEGSKLINKIDSIIYKSSIKFDLEVPSSVKRAHDIYEAFGNIFWKDLIDKEMRNGIVIFQLLEKD